MELPDGVHEAVYDSGFYLSVPNVENEGSFKTGGFGGYPPFVCCVPGTVRLLAGAFRERTKLRIPFRGIVWEILRGKSSPS